ncbi:hypothetical protein H5410_031715 [Solanum commersonii]|uniref:Ulp1 protease family, C-terminal catalytic domain containing protein n=1 Tax=Solanum commersonii TaxID=4109 RepID=A0A9J5YJ41_SOLCO|nr:hypothetical protein H5410_031715 [Solanum commersonii]
MDHPSFSIGITQVVISNTNRIFDYEDPNWAENRPKRLHDPLTMAKQSLKKSKAKKEAHAKTPKKRGRLSLPYPDLHDQFIPKCNYQGQITKCLLLLEVEQDNPAGELHIRQAKGNILNFSIKEFAIITGLKCKGNSDWDNIDDALQMAIMYFIHTFVFSQLGDATIPIEDFLMNICPNIQPTAEEITSLDLPHINHVSPIKPAPSNVNPEDGQPKEVPGFEDFSSKPLDQLLRRSTRVSSTGFTPPPKRKKVVRPHKINVSKAIQPDEHPNQTFQTPNLPMSEADNVSGVLDNSDIRKVILDNSELEELKQYVKGYVRVNKTNHSELMKVVGAKDNKSEKDIGGISTSYMVDDSVEKDNVDPQSTSVQFFQQPISPIHMDFSIHDQDIGRSAVDSDDTSFKEQVMEDATDVIPTTHHSHVSIEETVVNKEAASIDLLDH